MTDLQKAAQALLENARIDKVTMTEILWRWFPDADDAEIDAAVDEVLQ